MAVDRPADYPGNHGGAYTDIDGMRKQFTVIDHDRKTKISFSKEADLDSVEQRRLEIIESLDLSDPKVIDFFNLHWNTALLKLPSYSTITRDTLEEEYTPLYILEKLKTLLNG